MSDFAEPNEPTAEEECVYIRGQLAAVQRDLEAAKRERDEARELRDIAEAKARWIDGINYTTSARDLAGKLPPDVLMAPMPFPDRIEYAAKIIQSAFEYWMGDQEYLVAITDAREEREKFRVAASVLCGSHIGLPQQACPACDRDALAAQVERLREALEKVASLINESTGVAGLHLNGEIAPWCDLMTGGKYEGWLCGVFESLQLDAPTALRERLEAETKPLVEALECAAKVAIGDDELHIEGCPEDDTCHCKNAQTINRGMAIVAATKARLEGGSR